MNAFSVAFAMIAPEVSGLIEPTLLYGREMEDGTAVYNLIGSGTVSIDEVRQRQGKEPLNTDWSKAHYMSLNLTRIENLQSTARKEE